MIPTRGSILFSHILWYKDVPKNNSFIFNNDDVSITTEDIVKDIIEEVHSTDVVPRTSAYNIGKLNIEVLRKEQQQDQFCKNKVKEMKKKPDPNYLLDNISTLQKV